MRLGHSRLALLAIGVTACGGVGLVPPEGVGDLGAADLAFPTQVAELGATEAADLDESVKLAIDPSKNARHSVSLTPSSPSKTPRTTVKRTEKARTDLDEDGLRKSEFR